MQIDDAGQAAIRRGGDAGAVMRGLQPLAPRVAQHHVLAVVLVAGEHKGSKEQ